MADQDLNNLQPFKPIKWLKSPSAAIYFTYFLSSWGDRMWHFAVGLYLVIFDEGVLRLAAVYGFTNGICILFLGGLIGHWVDIYPRLRVVRVALFIQNTCVALSAVSISLMLVYQDHFLHTPANSRQRHLLEALIMFLAILASLSSVAYKVSIEKDWVVVVAAGNKAQLASLNATTRAIDLVSKALSPLVVAQIMTFGSRLIGAIFIAVWNVVSVWLEYALLMRVYRLVPRLKFKENHDSAQEEKSATKNGCQNGGESPEEVGKGKQDGDDTEELDLDQQISNKNHLLEGALECESKPTEEVVDDVLTDEQRRAMMETDALAPNKRASSYPPRPPKKRNRFVGLLLGPFIRLVGGWSLYARHKVCFAGVALGCLFMTVLGFDSITVGYIYSQGISESVLGICTSLSAVTGIVGTFIYTRFRKAIGVNKTGIFGFSFEVMCLSLALISIWTPGSPFGVKKTQESNCTVARHDASQNTTRLLSLNESSSIRVRKRRDMSDLLFLSPDAIISVPLTDTLSLGGLHGDYKYARTRRAVQNINVNTSDMFIPYQVLGEETEKKGLTSPPCSTPDVPKTSVILFLTGIIASRIGLWIADLCVTQIFQENVDECERGTLGGVQNSVNMLLDTIKFILVIVLPDIHTFGILIILSYSFIILADCFFITYVTQYNGGCAKLFSPKSKRKPEVNIIYRPKDPSLTSSKV